MRTRCIGDAPDIMCAAHFKMLNMNTFLREYWDLSRLVELELTGRRSPVAGADGYADRPAT